MEALVLHLLYIEVSYKRYFMHLWTKHANIIL